MLGKLAATVPDGNPAPPRPLQPTTLQAALAEAGDAVPEHLQVDLPPGAASGEGSGVLATVLERSRR